jgi:hypothetical protein
MRGGKYISHKERAMTLAAFKAFAERMNVLSMFEVRWSFKREGKRLSDAELSETCLQYPGLSVDQLREKARAKPVPFNVRAVSFYSFAILC